MKFQKSDIPRQKNIKQEEITQEKLNRLSGVRKRKLNQEAKKYPLFAEEMKERKNTEMMPIEKYCDAKHEKKKMFAKTIREIQAQRWKRLRNLYFSLPVEQRQQVIARYEKEANRHEKPLYTQNMLEVALNIVARKK